MSLWFSGSSVIQQLREAWGVGLGQASLITVLVQLGFVAGALVSAVFNLSDVFPATRVFSAAALAAATANLAFALAAGRHMHVALVFRFLTGLCLAGVYPTGMKIVASWTMTRRSIALSALVGSLTIGSAVPHALNAWTHFPWRGVVLSCSLLAVVAAAIVRYGVADGPLVSRESPFRLRQIGELVRNRKMLFTQLGYLGHMWELYSMWAWVALLLGVHRPKGRAEGMAFIAIAVGAIGCLCGGLMADRNSGTDSRLTVLLRRSGVAIAAMGTSAACCVLAALVMNNFYVLALVSLFWGVAVIADSPQFSAIISEVSDRDYVGTALAVQTAAGYMLTAISIRLTVYLVDVFGWQVGLVALAIGPILGCIAMWRLQITVAAEARPVAQENVQAISSRL